MTDECDQASVFKDFAPVFISNRQIESERDIFWLRGEPIPKDLLDPEDDAYVEYVEEEVERDYNVTFWYTDEEIISVRARDEDEAYKKAKEDFWEEIDNYEVEEVKQGEKACDH